MPKPLVSLANLPQLAADLLITTLGLKRVGWVGRGDTVVPFAGAGENGEDIVTGGLEGELQVTNSCLPDRLSLAAKEYISADIPFL